MSRFHLPSGASRPATLSLAGLTIAAVAIVAIAAYPARPAAEPSTPARSSSSATPSAPASPSPHPTAVPNPVVTPKPPASSPPDVDGTPITVDLHTFDGHAVSIDVIDRTGSIVSAVSGRPGDNPSADGLAVTNDDDRTLWLTWVDFPIDNQLTLFVNEVGGHLRLQLIQPAPTGETDAVGMDRQLILTFDHAVDASTVEGIIQAGLDT